jgi:catechol 2,3-dioxygenase-like lactoylglutathione lyase family enzyme
VQVTVPKGSEGGARHFYCRVLGLIEIEKPVELKVNGGFWVQLGDLQVHIGIENGIDRQNTKAHIAYEVSDIAAWRQRLNELQITINEDIPIPGYERLSFRDPFGNKIEFLESC